MEQKRKVKSLLPHKINKNKKCLTFLLLFLSVVLCIWSVSLMTMSVMAGTESFPLNNVDYTWSDDSVEVLYRLRFSDKTEDWNEDVNELYMSGDILYLVPNQLILSGNSVDTWKYINILWWLGNHIESDNITIVAWYNNMIYSDNSGASLLWWEDNIISWSSSWAPAVIVWWL